MRRAGGFIAPKFLLNISITMSIFNSLTENHCADFPQQIIHRNIITPMKKLAITLAFLISLNVFSQEKKIFSTELNEFVLQCENIGRTIIDKNKATDLTEWYAGRDNEITERNIKQLESDIDNSILDVTYHLTMIYENPRLYRLHFYSQETNEEFGQLYLSFRDTRHNLVGDLKFLSKEKMEMIDLKPNENSSLFNMPAVFKKSRD